MDKMIEEEGKPLLSASDTTVQHTTVTCDVCNAHVEISVLEFTNGAHCQSCQAFVILPSVRNAVGADRCHRCQGCHTLLQIGKTTRSWSRCARCALLIDLAPGSPAYQCGGCYRLWKSSYSPTKKCDYCERTNFLGFGLPWFCWLVGSALLLAFSLAVMLLLILTAGSGGVDGNVFYLFISIGIGAILLIWTLSAPFVCRYAQKRSSEEIQSLLTSDDLQDSRIIDQNFIPPGSSYVARVATMTTQVN